MSTAETKTKKRGWQNLAGELADARSKMQVVQGVNSDLRAEIKELKTEVCRRDQRIADLEAALVETMHERNEARLRVKDFREYSAADLDAAIVYLMRLRDECSQI